MAMAIGFAIIRRPAARIAAIRVAAPPPLMLILIFALPLSLDAEFAATFPL